MSHAHLKETHSHSALTCSDTSSKHACVPTLYVISHLNKAYCVIRIIVKITEINTFLF